MSKNLPPELDLVRVFSDPSNASSATSSLASALDVALASALAIADPPQRRHQCAQLVLTLIDSVTELCDLPEPNLPDMALYGWLLKRSTLAHQAKVCCQQAVERLRGLGLCRSARSLDTSGAAGASPYRHPERGYLRLVDLAAISTPTASGRQLDAAAVAPFLHLDAAVRARATSAYVMNRPMEPGDLWPSDSPTLVGQQGVFAAREIPAGTCIGIYGGEVLDRLDGLLLQDRRYLSEPKSLGAERVFVNGNGMMSLSNSCFYPPRGAVPVSREEEGFVLERVCWDAHFEGGLAFAVWGFSTVEDLAPGTELRWDYGQGPQTRRLPG